MGLPHCAMPVPAVRRPVVGAVVLPEPDAPLKSVAVDFMNAIIAVMLRVSLAPNHAVRQQTAFVTPPAAEYLLTGDLP